MSSNSLPISSIDAPSRSKLAVSRKRVQRYSHNRKNKEVEKLEFSENLAQIKNILKEKELSLSEYQNPRIATPITGITGPYPIEEISIFPNGFANPKIMTKVINRSNETLTDASVFKLKAEENLMTIKENIQNGITLNIYSVKEIIRMKELYSDNTSMLTEILKLLRQDVLIRNQRTRKNLIQNFGDFMNEVPNLQNKIIRAKPNSRISNIDEYIRAIIINELDIASENLTIAFLENKISFEEYIKKKNMIYEDANNFWQ